MVDSDAQRLQELRLSILRPLKQSPVADTKKMRSRDPPVMWGHRNSPADRSVTGAWAGMANEIPEMSRSSSLQSVSVNWLGEPPRPMRIGLMEDVDVFSRLRSFHACLLSLRQLDHVTNPYAWGRFACRRIHSGYFTFQKPIEMLSADQARLGLLVWRMLQSQDPQPFSSPTAQECYQLVLNSVTWNGTVSDWKIDEMAMGPCVKVPTSLHTYKSKVVTSNLLGFPEDPSLHVFDTKDETRSAFNPIQSISVPGLIGEERCTARSEIWDTAFVEGEHVMAGGGCLLLLSIERGLLAWQPTAAVKPKLSKMVMLSNNTLLSGHSDGSLRVWDTRCPTWCDQAEAVGAPRQVASLKKVNCNVCLLRTVENKVMSFDIRKPVHSSSQLPLRMYVVAESLTKPVISQELSVDSQGAAFFLPDSQQAVVVDISSGCLLKHIRLENTDGSSSNPVVFQCPPHLLRLVEAREPPNTSVGSFLLASAREIAALATQSSAFIWFIKDFGFMYLFRHMDARLLLSNGLSFEGRYFGSRRRTSGEVVFTTAMTGYVQSLTDPSYTRQILTLTYPLAGNYGVPSAAKDAFGFPLHHESDRIQVAGLVVASLTGEPSHQDSVQTLSAWLEEHNVPGICGVDTRALTKAIRKHGSTVGWIQPIDDPIPMDFPDPSTSCLSRFVSRKDVLELQSAYQGELLVEKEIRITVVDCGVKTNILRYLLYKLPYNIRVRVVPYDYRWANEECDGVLISNGPGDPALCLPTIREIAEYLKRQRPFFGICLGHQLLALAVGAKTRKMPLGNRGLNQPVIDTRTTRCYITSQNHGYEVDASSLPPQWCELFINANDQTNEGIVHTQMPWFSVQFHPEHRAGPTDTSFLFHDFMRSVTSPSRLLLTAPVKFPKVYSKVLILGSGGISIGQAGEFDYSGSQCIKALRDSGVKSVLINPNIATVQTGLCDQTYYLPVTPFFVEEVIRKEKPDGIFCTFGGQTALNCAVELHKFGVFERYGVEVLGTSIESIMATEDREVFAQRLKSIGETVALSDAATSVDQAVAIADRIRYPVLVRGAYCLGGLGSGVAHNREEVRSLSTAAFAVTPQVLIDKSLHGWKEVEYEIIRDRFDNCIAVCNMENFDPLGIHTGDSIVVAPSQTLTDEEYFRLRESSLKIIRHFAIIGECNVQFALCPTTGVHCVVEVNARLSRSSALASKATGYPLAYMAARLGLRQDLVSLRNSVTRNTSACCEPALDYCVVKVPRWDLRKFSRVDKRMGSCMKSVGEVLAIGRTFEEAIQKGLRMVTDNDSTGFSPAYCPIEDLDELKTELANPSPGRIWAVAKAFEKGLTVEHVFQLTSIDRFFLYKLESIIRTRHQLSTEGQENLDRYRLLIAKQFGFSDLELSRVLSCSEAAIREKRHGLGVFPVIKQIDTTAAEFTAQTNYLYVTYNGTESDVLSAKEELYKSPSGARPRNRDETNPQRLLSFRRTATTQKKLCVMVLGCGCYKIGSSVEFDWSAMACVKTLRNLGHHVIMVNCNPETVSTDFDETDRLYFENVSLEDVHEIYLKERADGVIISVGGQVPNNLAMKLAALQVPILGTSVQSIDRAEDRSKFSALCDSLGIDQPQWSAFTSFESALRFCEDVAFPVLVRPSYVLSGASMRVSTTPNDLKDFLLSASVVSPDFPVVISKYIVGAKEVEMDAVACNGVVLNYAISEHVENAGVHSGDATLILPAQNLYVETIRRVRRTSEKIAKALNISGPFNMQFMCKKNAVKVIECNLRASRTFPFISRTLNVNFIELAARIFVGAPARPEQVKLLDQDFVGVKCPMFSFGRLRGSDPIMGVEMQSTGEVCAFGPHVHEAFLKSWLATGHALPVNAFMLAIGPLHEKLEMVDPVKKLLGMGYSIYCTAGTHSVLTDELNGDPLAEQLQAIDIDDAAALLKEGAVDCIINIPTDAYAKCPDLITKGYLTRRTATDFNIPLITNSKVARIMVDALARKHRREGEAKSFWDITSWQSYIENNSSYVRDSLDC